MRKGNFDEFPLQLIMNIATVVGILYFEGISEACSFRVWASVFCWLSRRFSQNSFRIKNSFFHSPIFFPCCNSLCLLSFLLCAGGFKMLYAILPVSGYMLWREAYNIISSFSPSFFSNIASLCLAREKRRNGYL